MDKAADANGAEEAQRILDLEVPSSRRTLGPALAQAFRWLGIAFVAFHLWVLLVHPIDPTVGRPVHVYVGAIIGLGLFAASHRARLDRIAWYDWMMMAACVGIVAHYALDADGIEMRAFLGPNWRDTIVGVAAIAVLLEFTRRTAGIAMPIIALVFISYIFLGPWLPGALYHTGVPWREAVNFLAGMEGIFGITTSVSATFIIMFVTFAAFLQTSKAGDFFNDLAMGLVGWARGGPAKVAVVSSSMFGAVSGSSVANVVASGTFTIPMMKRAGYDADTAGAVEATASTGGQLAPPVMGAGAFIMAEVLGVPYQEILIAGIIPALLYYVACYSHADLHALKAGLRGLPLSELPSLPKLMLRAYLFAPLVILIAVLLSGYSPFRAAGLGIAATVVIMFATFLAHRVFIARENPLAALAGSLWQLWLAICEALAGGSREALQLIAVCATAGIVAGVIGLTGIGGRFATILLELGGAVPILALTFAAVVALILGMGVPTTAAYAIAAAVVAPGLIRMGIQPLVAHMFIFYYAVLSAITPPVALASFAAAGLARGSLWGTSLTALKFGMATFLVPYMFYLNPVLLAQGALTDILQALATGVIGVVLLACATEGYLGGRLPLALRLVTGLAAVLCIIPEGLTDLAGVAVGVAIYGWQRWSARGTPALAQGNGKGGD
ncbi:TRAP transporter permease [Elioraea sp. Yellowstone]|jgi:TRAP transporter 4TM/12TM fusion protein|uniref:TRAP transporter permease n=1 Tax=Elioraea sp. Yellowstone TaxID=2592070 RepID=UPI0011512941|nr:TRAP transporter permease [Elioraea sp. Yellowstone]TQF76456.1 TRAP transporter permease [Elioraea sp. Yellowstone]